MRVVAAAVVAAFCVLLTLNHDAAHAKGPNRVSFDAVIANGGVIPPPGSAVALSFTVQIDWMNLSDTSPSEAGMPQALAGAGEAYLFRNSGVTFATGPGLPGSNMTAASIGARMGQYDFQRKTNWGQPLIFTQNVAPSGPHAGAVANCGDNDTSNWTRHYTDNPLTSDTYFHAQWVQPLVIGDMSGRDVLATSLLAPGWQASEYVAGGGELVQSYDDDNDNGVQDVAEGSIAEPTFTRTAGYEDPYANSNQYHPHAPELQHDTDHDGIADGAEGMPDFLPMLTEALGLRSYWLQRGFAWLHILPGVIGHGLHLLSFDGLPGTSAFSLFLTQSRLVPRHPYFQTDVICTPLNLTVKYDAITSAAELCLYDNDCNLPPPGVTDTGDTVASISAFGAQSTSFYMSDTDDYDADGRVEPEDICPRDPDNSDPDGDIISGICDADPLSWDNDGDGDASLDDRALSIKALLGIGAPLAACKTAGNGICDNDVDDDDWINNQDNCETVSNVDQLDSDGDQVGDACDEFLVTAYAAGKGPGDGITSSANIDNDLLCVETWSVGGTEPAGDGIPVGGCTDIDDANDNGIADIDDTSSDSDGDGFSDAFEAQFGSNPLDPGSVPLACIVQIPNAQDADSDYLRDDCDPYPVSDCDSDGVLDGIEQGAGTQLCSGAYPPGVDDDGDGCLNEVELAADPARHPGNWWDNYDVTASGDIDLADTLAILQQFGELDHQQFDRTRLTLPGPPALVVEANDGIDLQEALTNLYQFGWGGCSAPGPTPPHGGGRFD